MEWLLYTIPKVYIIISLSKLFKQTLAQSGESTPLITYRTVLEQDSYFNFLSAYKSNMLYMYN